MKYDFTAIEKKWQEKWLEEKPFTAVTGDKTREKFYGLIEFPYPSGQGLHVGHARPFTAMDIICRKKRMQGYNVLFPIGFDAFGLPTENYAIKNHIHPAIVTKQNIANFTKQLHMLGYSFDWDRVVDTTDPSYYKWTQWIFLQLFKKGLAYKASMPVNWCTSCKCVLANEEVVEGVCERCGSEVIRKEKSQWMLAITKYADRLIDDLDDVDYIERVKIQQRNWIGRSEGTEVDFTATNGDKLTVWTEGKLIQHFIKFHISLKFHHILVSPGKKAILLPAPFQKSADRFWKRKSILQFMEIQKFNIRQTINHKFNIPTSQFIR